MEIGTSFFDHHYCKSCLIKKSYCKWLNDSENPPSEQKKFYGLSMPRKKKSSSPLWRAKFETKGKFTFSWYMQPKFGIAELW